MLAAQLGSDTLRNSFIALTVGLAAGVVWNVYLAGGDCAKRAAGHLVIFRKLRATTTRRL